MYYNYIYITSHVTCPILPHSHGFFFQLPASRWPELCSASGCTVEPSWTFCPRFPGPAWRPETELKRDTRCTRCTVRTPAAWWWMISLWFPHDVPIPYYFRILFLLFTYYLPIISILVPITSFLFPYYIPIISLLLNYVPIISLLFPYHFFLAG